MATYDYKGLIGEFYQVSISDPSTSTLGDLIDAIANDEGLPSSYYIIVAQKDKSINTENISNTTTIENAGIDDGDTLISAAKQQGTKEDRQTQRLEIAQLKRQGGKNGDTTKVYFRDRNVYDISELPTQYDGNDVLDNPNSGGLEDGRPWDAP